MAAPHKDVEPRTGVLPAEPRRLAAGLRRLRRTDHRAWFVHASQPKIVDAWIADAKLALRARGEQHEIRSRLDGIVQAIRLMWSTDAFAALALYRVQARADALGVPIVPRLAHHLSIILGQVCIGRPVVVRPGVLIPHGQVIIDGFTVIEAGVAIRPWVTIGLIEKQRQGPKIGKNVKIGTGAKVLGPITIGDEARIGANAVVLHDVAAGTTVVGAPAREVQSS
jgi:serine O-acetyltransferase